LVRQSSPPPWAPPIPLFSLDSGYPLSKSLLKQNPRPNPNPIWASCSWCPLGFSIMAQSPKEFCDCLLFPPTANWPPGHSSDLGTFFPFWGLLLVLPPSRTQRKLIVPGQVLALYLQGWFDNPFLEQGNSLVLCFSEWWPPCDPHPVSRVIFSPPPRDGPGSSLLFQKTTNNPPPHKISFGARRPFVLPPQHNSFGPMAGFFFFFFSPHKNRSLIKDPIGLPFGTKNRCRFFTPRAHPLRGPLTLWFR